MIKKLLYTYAGIIILTLLFIQWAIYTIGSGGGIYISYIALFITNFIYVLIDLGWTWIAFFLSDMLRQFFSLNKRYFLPIFEFLICVIYLLFRPSLGFDGQMRYLSYLPVLLPKIINAAANIAAKSK